MSDSQTLAERCAAAMYAADAASRAHGITIEQVAPGVATATMTVTETMINGHAIAHGGLIFMLADTAFAFACNTYNQVTVAQHCSISFLNPARLGDRLRAEARERVRQGRSGIYDVRVTSQDGTLIAEFRGHSRVVRGHLVPELADETGQAREPA